MTSPADAVEKLRSTFIWGTSPVFEGDRDAAGAEFDRLLGEVVQAAVADADRPAPCVQVHVPPFDFAQCNTHDETFPVGGSCRWAGETSIVAVLQAEADEQRARAVRAEVELARRA